MLHRSDLVVGTPLLVVAKERTENVGEEQAEGVDGEVIRGEEAYEDGEDRAKYGDSGEVTALKVFSEAI